MRILRMLNRVFLPCVLGLFLDAAMLPASVVWAQNADIPKSARADILKLQADQALKKNDHNGVLKAIQQIRDLKEPVPASLLFMEAKAAEATGDPIRAVNALTAYFNTATRDDERYPEAIALMPGLEARAAEVRRLAEATRAGELRDDLEKAVVETLRQLNAALVPIPAGSYQMGDIHGTGEPQERPVHAVTVPAFQLMKYEVTFDQYDTFARLTGRTLPEAWGWGRGNRPVINVSWKDTQAFAAWVSEQTGKRWRLPTEAEWEYAARAGTTTDYPWGKKFDKSRANNGPTTDPVGSFPPNAWGVYDMQGNAWELLQDCWTPHYRGAPADGSAWTAGNCKSRVVRGGSWYYDSSWLRSSYRGTIDSAARTVNIGFRLARDE